MNKKMFCDPQILQPKLKNGVFNGPCQTDERRGRGRKRTTNSERNVAKCGILLVMLRLQIQ